MFFGTPAFSVPTLERLLGGSHPVVGVVSQPDRRRGRGRKSTPSPVSEVALREELPLLRPERVADDDFERKFADLAPDLGVVVAFGQFLPKRIREAPTEGYLINGHASLLPKYRGAAPIARAIMEGATRTGISVMRVEREMDAGAVALERDLEIGPEETTGELTERLAALCADAIAEVIPQIAAGAAKWSEQDTARATFAPKISRSDTVLDWNDSALALVRRIRALAPAPAANSQIGETALSFLAARATGGPVDAPPGTVKRDDGGTLRIATGSGWLLPLRVKRAGGSELGIDAYLRGRPTPDGARFSPAANLSS